MPANSILSLRIGLLIGGWLVILCSFFLLMKDWPSLQQWQEAIIAKGRIGAVATFMIIFFVATVMRALRWGLLICREVSLEWKSLIVWFMWWFFLSAFSPFRSGDVVRPLWIKKHGGSAAVAFGALAMERLTDLMVLFSLIGIVGALTPTADQWTSTIGKSVVFVVLLVYAVLVTFAPFLSRLILRLNRLNSDKSKRNPLAYGYRLLQGIIYFRDYRVGVPVVILTFAVWILLSVGYWLFLGSFFKDLHWTIPVAVLVATNLSGLVSIAPGNVGMYQLAAASVLVAFSLPSSVALTAAVVLHGVILLTVTVLGLVAKAVLWQQGNTFTQIV